MTDRRLKFVHFVGIVMMAQLLFSQFSGVYSASDVAERLSGDRRICNFDGKELTVIGDIFAFRPDINALNAFKKVLAPIGISDPEVIHLRATSTLNAAAVIFGEDRYVFYNQSFITKLASKSGTDWAAAGILAHEIGHHILFHSLKPKSGDERIMQELEADKYAGTIMRKMNATQEEAKIGFKQTNVVATVNYPKRDDRLAAVVNGWLEEDQRIKASIAEGSNLHTVHILDTPGEAFQEWKATYSIDGQGIGTIDSFYDRVADLSTALTPGKHLLSYSVSYKGFNNNYSRSCSKEFMVYADTTLMMNRSITGPSTMQCDLVEQDNALQDVRFEQHLVNPQPGMFSLVRIEVDGRSIGKLELNQDHWKDSFVVQLSRAKHQFNVDFITTFPPLPGKTAHCLGEFLVTGPMTIGPQMLTTPLGPKCVIRNLLSGPV